MEKDSGEELLRLKKALKAAEERVFELENSKSNHNFYEHLFEVSRDLACMAGTDGFFKVVNPAFEKVLGYSREEMLNTSFLLLVHPDDFDLTVRTLQKLKSDEMVINFENRYQTKSGAYVDLQWMATPDAASETIYAIARDITAQKRETTAIFESEKLLKDAVKMAHLGSFEFTFENEILTWSEELFNIFELVEDPSTKLYFQYMSRLSESDINLIKNKIGFSVQTGEPYVVEHNVHLPDGRTKVVFASAIPVKDKSGRVLKLRGIVQDITLKKKEEELMLNAVKEKETLIKEIHHRVKNNLQVISSLLNLQANVIQDDQMKRLYADSQNRIKAMASIHELLYKSDNFSKIDYAPYLKRLVYDLIYSLHGESHEIEVDLDLPPQLLDLDAAVPLGLLVNEIVTNSLKHGIPKNQKGKIYLKMSSKAVGDFELRIGDSGPGFNFKGKALENETLGLMLIENLASQLNGSVQFDEQNPGSNYILKFKYLDNSSQRLAAFGQQDAFKSLEN